MVQGTCSKQCAWREQYGKRCPNFIRTDWTDERGGQRIQVDDCAPKRAVLLLMHYDQRVLGLQAAAEADRNAQQALLRGLINIASRHGVEIGAAEEPPAAQLEEGHP